MKTFKCLTVVMAIVVASAFASEDDSLSKPLCNAPNQILMKKDGSSYSYAINDLLVKFDIVKLHLREKENSRQYLNSYYTVRIVGSVLAIAGSACVLTNVLISPDKPGSPLGLTGYGLMIIGLGINFSSHGKLKLSIQAYNKDICNGM
jgi:hypothetical protein